MLTPEPGMIGSTAGGDSFAFPVRAAVCRTAAMTLAFFFGALLVAPLPRIALPRATPIGWSVGVNVPLRGSDILHQLPDSLRVKMLACIAQGDVTGAIALYQLATGQERIPTWLRAFQAAFGAANQVVGSCSRVARDVFEGLRQLGASPQYIRLSSTAGRFLSWQGRIIMSDNNTHFAVRNGDKIIDAFTGPAGMTTAEYLQQVMMRGKPVIEVVTVP